MIATTTSVAPIGFNGQIISIECDTSKGLPALQIVGLANKSIDEAKERVRSAITNSHLNFPARRVTVNLAPANLPKEGSHYDLPIAISILLESGQIRYKNINDIAFAGELSLSGQLRPIRGTIAIAEAARQSGISTLILPKENALQASLIRGIDVIGATSITDIFLHLSGEKKLPVTSSSLPKFDDKKTSICIDDVVGQEQAKRALLIAVAGHHNILLDGPPGAGKTMLARTCTSIMPRPTYQEMIEITKLHNLCGEADDTILTTRPFRSPHPTASFISLVGGGTRPTPGEVSLAHHGILFLDELPEYPRASLEALRQPLEDRVINVSRASQKTTYPANFMLIATKNPCPCGYFGDATRECSCTMQQILTYQKRISGPLLDRIDMTIHVSRVSEDALSKPNLKSSRSQSDEWQKLVSLARSRQYLRNGSKTNAELSTQEVRAIANLTPEAEQLLSTASRKLSLSARSYFKLIKLARTIADLEDYSSISPSHIAEALQFRGNNDIR